VVDLLPHSKFFDDGYLGIFRFDGDRSPAALVTNLLEPSSRVSSQDSDASGSPGGRPAQEEPRPPSLEKLRIADLSLEQVRSPDEAAAASRKNGLGSLYFCAFGAVELKVREIKIGDISAYVLRQATEEIRALNQQLQTPCVEKPCRLLSGSAAQYLVTLSVQGFEPLDLLVRRREVGLKQAVQIMALVAKAMHGLAKTGRGYSHGHLSPGNIAVAASHQVHRSLERVRILDLGFTFLKKYASLLAGYCNKSCYTAPEKLVLRGNVIEAPSQEADVYSFSLVLWYPSLTRQLLAHEQPFPDMPLPELQVLVLEKKARPKLDPEWPPRLSSLLRRCWDQDPNSRPSFNEIAQLLNFV